MIRFGFSHLPSATFTKKSPCWDKYAMPKAQHTQPKVVALGLLVSSAQDDVSAMRIILDHERKHDCTYRYRYYNLDTHPLDVGWIRDVDDRFRHICLLSIFYSTLGTSILFEIGPMHPRPKAHG